MLENAQRQLEGTWRSNGLCSCLYFSLAATSFCSLLIMLHCLWPFDCILFSRRNMFQQDFQCHFFVSAWATEIHWDTKMALYCRASTTWLYYMLFISSLPIFSFWIILDYFINIKSVSWVHFLYTLHAKKGHLKLSWRLFRYTAHFSLLFGKLFSARRLWVNSTTEGRAKS